MHTCGQPKILHVTYSDPDIYSPIISSARLLAKNGYKVDILGYYRGRQNTVDYGDGIRLIRGNDLLGDWPRTIAQKIAGFSSLTRRITHLTKENNYGLVVGNDATAFWASAKICLPAKIPLVYHCHDFSGVAKSFFSMPTFGDIISSSSSKLACRADAVVFPEQSRAAWGKLTWRLNNPVFVAANAPLLQPLKKTNRLKEMFAKSGFSPEYIVVRKGAISFDHGLKETLEALALCPSTWGLALIGYQNVDAVRDFAKKLGVERQILFTGFVPYDSTWEYISSADIGLSLYRPSNINTIMQATASQKVFEYMASGIPSIAYGSPDFLSLARETKAIFTIKEITPQAIAAGLTQVLRNRSNYESMSENAYAAHFGFFNYETQYAPVLELINAIFKKRNLR